MGDELEAFVEKFANTYVKWDLLTFFFGGSHRVQGISSAELADALGREPVSIEEGLKALTDAGLLEKINREGVMLYHPAEREGGPGQVRQFLNFSGTREGRLRTLYWITRHRLQHPASSY